MDTAELSHPAVMSHLEAIPDEHSRDKLTLQLGRIAQQRHESGYYHTQREFAPESEPSPLIQQQVEMLAGFYSHAANELAGTPAKEDDIWDRVYDNQLATLAELPNRPDVENFDQSYNQLLLNVLVGNSLCMYGLEPEQAEEKLRDRVWRFARTGKGMDLLRASAENSDLMVMDDDNDQPYKPVRAQLDPYNTLLVSTDDTMNVDHALQMPVLAEADIDNKTWFFERCVHRGDRSLANANITYLTPDDALGVARKVCETNPYEGSQFLRLENVVEKINAVDRALLVAGLGRNPTWEGIDIASLTESEQTKVASKLLEGPEPHTGYTSLYNFTQLEGALLDKLLTTELVRDQPHMLDLAAFSTISKDAYEKLRALEISLYKIAVVADRIEGINQRELAEEFFEKYSGTSVIENMDHFPDLSKTEIIDMAIKHNNASSVLANISSFTDGSDKQLIGELLDHLSNMGGIWNLEKELPKMPTLDGEWMRDELLKHKEYATIARCLPHLPDVDKAVLLENILATNPNPQWVLDSTTLPYFESLGKENVLEQLYKSHGYATIADNAQFFGDNCASDLWERIKETGNFEVIGQSIGNFEFIDKRELADLIVKSGNGLSVLGRHPKLFTDAGVDETWLIDQVLTDSEAAGTMMFNLQDLMCDRAVLGKKYLASGNVSNIIEKIDKFKMLNIDEVVEAGFAQHAYYELGSCLPHLEAAGANVRAIADRLLDENQQSNLLCAGPDSLKGLNFTASELLDKNAAYMVLSLGDVLPDYNEKSAIQNMVDHGQWSDIVFSLDKLIQPLDEDTTLNIIKQGFSDILIEYPEKFSPLTENLFIAALESSSPYALLLYKDSKLKLPWVDLAIKQLGDEPLPALVLAAKKINESSSPETLPTFLVEMGVRKIGAPGIEQLKRVNEKVRKQLLSAENGNGEEFEQLAQLITNNPLGQGIAKSLVRYTSSVWGSHTDKDWKELIEFHRQHRDELPTLPEGFVPSETINIRTLNTEMFDAGKIDEDAAARFTVLRDDIASALSITRGPRQGRYQHLFDRGRKILEPELERLNELHKELTAQNKEKAAINLQEKITTIQELLDSSPKDFMKTMQHSFDKLTSLKIKELDRLVRVGMYARAIKKSPAAAQTARHLQLKPDASLESINHVLDFNDHILNQEVFHDYFSTTSASKAFEKLTATDALQNQLKKSMSADTIGTTPIQFIPTRGLLLELSGHMGDACWASKYDSIAQEFPNVSALTMLRNPGEPNERLVGSCLLIDTVDKTDGKPTLVLRGINPIQNFITGVKAEDFIGALTGYARKIAGDRKLAIVIDSQSGMAATNRPTLHEYLVTNILPKDGRQLELPEDTTFNGYVLDSTHPVYALPA